MVKSNIYFCIFYAVQVIELIMREIIWFQAREEELAVIDENDKEFLNQGNANRSMKQKLLFNKKR